jgi:hypothetical protein
MTMGFVVLRTQKLKSGAAIHRSMKHAFRTQTTPNADPTRTADNTHIGAQTVTEGLANFNARLANQEKVRKNAVLAIEYLISGSPDDIKGKTREQQDAYFRDALKWLEDKHGKVNVVYAGIHRDETTPHMYAYVVPFDQRGKLNCRSFLGGAKALTQMQTDFAKDVGQAHGLERGIEGSRARHTTVKQYYARASAGFEPLPEVKTTPPPKLRSEPEKPGMFAGRDVKDEYQQNHAKWEQERDAAQAQKQKHIAEVKAQRDAAVKTAKRHQAQAKEAAALKAEVGQLKQSNGVYAKTAAQSKAEVVKLLAVAELFTPEEIRAAQARKQQQEAEKARLAELARSKAAEVARVASIEAEAARRVQGVQKLLQSGGAEHTFGVRAATALKEAGGDASRVDWKAVETRAVIESMGRHGQSAENVTKALLAHSPLRADPASHAQLRDTIKLNAPQLEAKYQQDRATRDSGHRPR